MIGNGIRASKIKAWGTEKSIVMTYLRSIKKSKWSNCCSDTLKGARWPLWICFQTLFLPEKAMAPHSSHLAWKNPMDRGAWWAAVHGITNSQVRLSDFPFTFHFYALEKEMPTHSRVLAWRIPGTGEPGGLPSMGSHRVGHD